MKIYNELEVIKNVLDVQLAVKNHGLAIIPDYFSKQELIKINQEFEKALTRRSVGIQPMEYSNGRAAKAILSLIKKTDFPCIKSVFTDDFMEKVANAYFNNELYSLNKEIFIVNDVVGTKHHANDLHFDVKPTFKFFLYLTDTTAENGAFSCVPGSHKITKELRAKNGNKITYENRHITRELPVKEEDVISIEGTAGTLIIFTTEVFHRAGRVSKGERKVMRGHCRLLEDKNVSHQSFFSKVFSKLRFN